MIRNVHHRRLAAGADQVWELLTTLSSPDDRLWPGAGLPCVWTDRWRWVHGAGTDRCTTT